VGTDDPLKPSAVNGLATNIASSGPTGVHNQSVNASSTPADVGSGHRASQTQSIISVDETVPYSRGVDRSELLSSKSLCYYYSYYYYYYYYFEFLFNWLIFQELVQVRSCFSEVHFFIIVGAGLLTGFFYLTNGQNIDWLVSHCHC